MKTENISLSTNEKLTLLSNFSTMLSAGLPLLETVDAILEDSKGNQKKLLEALKADLTQGKHLHDTFLKFPSIFTKVTTNIIKAAEEAGTLDTTLKDVKENMRKEMEFNDKVKSSLIYPIFVIGVFGLVFLMILVVVVPKISSVFLRLNVDLPLPTQIMIFMSNAVIHYTIPLAVGLVFLFLVTVFLYKKQKKILLNLFFDLPLISDLARDIDLTTFSRSLFLLLNAGIPIVSALELTQDVVLKKEVAEGIRYTKEVVMSGRKISQGFRMRRNIFPGVLIRITEAGEKTGSLDKSMLEISEFLDYQVSGRLKTIISLLEPVMLVVVGGLIGGMMMAIIAPIYGLIGQVGMSR